MKATIQITNDVGEFIKEYEIEYERPKDLHNTLQDARKTWDEYYVKAITRTHDISYSHTYKEQYFKSNKN